MMGDEGATTEYGSWNTIMGGDTPEITVADYLGEYADDPAFVGVAAAYRAAVDAALPEGVTLAGNRFYGPYPYTELRWQQTRVAVTGVFLAKLLP